MKKCLIKKNCRMLFVVVCLIPCCTWFPRKELPNPDDVFLNVYPVSPFYTTAELSRPAVSSGENGWGVLWIDKSQQQYTLQFVPVNRGNSKSTFSAKLNFKIQHKIDTIGLFELRDTELFEQGIYKNSANPAAFNIVNPDPACVSPYYPEICWNGSVYAAAWSDVQDGNFEIYFACFTKDGNIIRAPTKVTNNPDPSVFPSLCWNGAAFGLVWVNAYTIYFANITQDSTPITPVQTTIRNNAIIAGISLVWNGETYAIAWQNEEPDNQYDICFALIDLAGTVSGKTYITGNPVDSEAPVLIWTGTGYGISWHEYTTTEKINSEIFFCSLDKTGSKKADPVRITAKTGLSLYPALDWNPDKQYFCLAWQDNSGGFFTIQYGFLSGNGQVQNTEKSISGNNTTFKSVDLLFPALQWNGEDFGLAFCARSGDPGCRIFFVY